MSGRIRTIKPEWLEDELLAAASDEARVLSVALLLMADDYGRGRASPAAIAAGAWRYQLEKDDGEHTREILARASRALRELAELRFVTLYEVSGQRYYAIRTWSKHQKVDRPSKPRIPEPPEQSLVETAAIAAPCTHSTNTREDSSSVSRGPRQPLAPDLRSPTSTSDLRPASEDRSSAREGAVELPSSADPTEAALRRGYQARYQREARDAWMTHVSDDPWIKRAALWCRQQPRPLEAAERFLDGAFGAGAPPSWRKNRHPWKWLGEDPGRTASFSTLPTGAMGEHETMGAARAAAMAAIPTMDLTSMEGESW